MVSGFYRSSQKTDAADLTGAGLRKSPNSGGSVSGRRKRKKGVEREKEREGERERAEGCRMPGQRAAGQQHKTHCPSVYTQPHPSPRPGPGPFLLSTCPHPCCHFSPFSSLIETNYTHLRLKWKKNAGEGHLCCTGAGGLIG